MIRTIARLSALLVLCAWSSAACGGKVVVDGMNDTASSTDGAGGSSGVSTGVGGCDAASHTIDVADFNVSCQVASDCVPVFLGDYCLGCVCAFSAINVADKMKYDAEQQIKAAGAPPGGCFCPATKAVCVKSQCATQTP